MRSLWFAWNGLETRTCQLANRVNLNRLGSTLFGTVSRLGDGVLWYVLMAVLPLVAGAQGLLLSARMAVTGAACTLLYKALKEGIRRRRPCYMVQSLHTTVPPLDRFSFPSGHTMHAVAFTALACASLPALGWVLIPFTILVAASRMVLGLHWATDVLAGAALGYIVAAVSMRVWIV